MSAGALPGGYRPPRLVPLLFAAVRWVPTLFKYIFKDLVRIFLLTSGAGGDHELWRAAAAAVRVRLECRAGAEDPGVLLAGDDHLFLPIAALFATTIVYGRLGADNEITAARSAGISHLSLAAPAAILGLLGSLLSIVLLCFIVPSFTLKVERVIYSNLAQLVADQIERTHQIRFDHANSTVTVFAQQAQALPVDPSRPRDQAVKLIAPMIVTYESTTAADRFAPVPEFFYLAREARALIRQYEDEDADITLSARLEGGTRLPAPLHRAAETEHAGLGQDDHLRTDSRPLPRARKHEVHGLLPAHAAAQRP